MLDHPWLRVVLGVLAAAALGALAARVALSVPANGGADGGAMGGGSAGAANAPGGGASGSAARASDGGTGSGGASSGSASSGDGSNGSGSGVQVSGTSGAVVVHVVGAVRRPGVYTLREGERVKDAVRKAGGATRRANAQGLNLAAPARDGQQIVMPERQDGAAAGSGAGGAGSGGAGATGDGTGPAAGGAAGAGSRGTGAAGTGSGGTGSGSAGTVAVDLNTASVEQLQTLDGVGPTTAQKIVQLRKERGGLSGVDDLDEVPGIGPKKLEALRAQLGG